jgi:hypothetical protein
MAQVTKAQLALEIEDNRRELREVQAELATAINARDNLFRALAQMTIWQFMVARCAKQL